MSVDFNDDLIVTLSSKNVIFLRFDISSRIFFAEIGVKVGL